MDNVITAHYHNDYSLIELTLLSAASGAAFQDGLNLIQGMVELNYFEDLFNNTASGYVVMNDSAGWIETFQFSGNEFLLLKLGKLSDEYGVLNKKFRVFSVTKRQSIQLGQSELYELNFCSEELLLTEQYKVSKSYQKKRVEEMVLDILTNKQFGLSVDSSVINYGKFEKTINLYNFIIPNLKPFDAINWLSTYAIPDNGYAGADMYFYENRFGYNFQSLNSLFKRIPYETYSYTAKNVETIVNSSISDRMKNILTFEIVDSYDKLQSISKGMFANKLLSVDIVTRQHKNTVFDYENYVSGNNNGKIANKLNDYKLTNNFTNRNDKKINQTYDSVYRLAFTNFGVDSYGELEQYKKRAQDVTNGNTTLAPNINAEITIPYRKSQKDLLLHTRVIVSIPGDPGITVGYTVNLELPSKNLQENKPNLDSYYTGKYLITSVRHIIDKKEFRTVLELSKESTQAPYNDIGAKPNGWDDAIKGKLIRFEDW